MNTGAIQIIAESLLVLAVAEWQIWRASNNRRVLKVLMFLVITQLLSAAASAQNFHVVTRSQHAVRYDKAAEDAYVKIAKFWFQKRLPDLHKAVPIYVTKERGGAGGATTFALDRGHAFRWRMRLQGSPDKILTDGIPHEVNHVVFYAHFRKPLPRFFDEGAAMLMESDTSRSRQHVIIARNRPPPLRSMMDRMQYPSSNIVTFYAAGSVVTAYMVNLKGPDTFIGFLRDSRKPSDKLHSFYGLTPEQLEAAAYKPVAAKTLYVFTDPKTCQPCRVLARDIAAGKFRGVRFIALKPGTAAYNTAREEFKRLNGKYPPVFPTVWKYGTTKYRTGYVSAAVLAKWISTVLRIVVTGISAVIDWRQRDPVKETEPTTFQTEPVSVTSEDWTGVKVLVLAPSQDVGIVRGTARLVAIKRFNKGPWSRKLADLTGGKATLILVSERAEASRYVAVCEAAGIEPGGWAVLVMVPKQNVGLLKGLAVSRIESIVQKKLKDAPVEAIFERKHSAVWAAIHAAMNTEQPKAAADPNTSLVDSVTGAAKAAIAKEFEKRAPESVKQLAAVAADLKELKNRPDAEVPKDDVPSGFLAGLIALLGAGYTLRETFRKKG